MQLQYCPNYPPLGGRPPPRKSIFKLPVCRDPIHPPPPPKPSDMPKDTLILVFQPPKNEDEPIDVDAIEPDINTELEYEYPTTGRNYS